MTKGVFYCGCRCGCTTAILDDNNEGCSFCMFDLPHRGMLWTVHKISAEMQFNKPTKVER